MVQELRKELRNLSDPKKARFFAGFFKTGKGEYAEGDIFLGITVPDARKIARKYRNLAMINIRDLLKSKIHEERFVALEILVMQYEAGTRATSAKIAQFYLQNAKSINNWDLVDTSAQYILGDYLYRFRQHPYKLEFVRMLSDRALEKLARSGNLWARRIAIVATHAFIKNNCFAETLHIAKRLIRDDQDLIHKAVGWMLREVGKRDQAAEEQFLKKYYKIMPRTMLRYAIEKFPENRRKIYLNGKI